MSQELTPEDRVYQRLITIEATAKSGGVKISEILERANVSQPSWSRWKNRKQSPTAANLIALEDALARLVPGAEQAGAA